MGTDAHTIAPVCGLSAVELAAAIKSGDLSSRQVVQDHLDRIDAVNSGLNAVVRRFDSEALAAADAAYAAVTPRFVPRPWRRPA